MGNPVDRRLYRNTSPTKLLARLETVSLLAIEKA